MSVFQQLRRRMNVFHFFFFAAGSLTRCMLFSRFSYTQYHSTDLLLSAASVRLTLLFRSIGERGACVCVCDDGIMRLFHFTLKRLLFPLEMYTMYMTTCPPCLLHCPHKHVTFVYSKKSHNISSCVCVRCMLFALL